jgi:hypothetical protein
LTDFTVVATRGSSIFINFGHWLQRPRYTRTHYVTFARSPNDYQKKSDDISAPNSIYHISPFLDAVRAPSNSNKGYNTIVSIDIRENKT